MGFPGLSDGKESACNAGDVGLISGSGRSPGEGKGYPFQYLCLENPHRQRSLVGYSPWGGKELDTNKTSGGGGIPVELFQILKDDAMKANLKNSVGLENISFHSNPSERQHQRMLKLSHNCIHLTR